MTHSSVLRGTCGPLATVLGTTPARDRSRNTERLTKTRRSLCFSVRHAPGSRDPKSFGRQAMTLIRLNGKGERMIYVARLDWGIAVTEPRTAFGVVDFAPDFAVPFLNSKSLTAVCRSPS
ncbi:hypothetical protein SKAU_G00379060 [Synaphobranchus kaupii]|uniref:Uncharacterized protein n=1 Tax=Synaphobranchus kaupii TaxID=118154 RepID=A0A9Q1ED95_SYNKA|nr:hypothetical protein SKAU_G00379060 [Synaphobranchus kaupii]